MAESERSASVEAPADALFAFLSEGPNDYRAGRGRRRGPLHGRGPREHRGDRGRAGGAGHRNYAYRLNLDDEYGNLAERFLLSGRYAVVVQSFGSGAGPDTDRLVLTDLVSGRRLYFGPRGNCCYGRVFLRRNGSLAFAYGATLIGRDPTGRLAEYPVVRIATVTRGGERIAAESPDIVGGSLTLSRDRRSLKYIEAGRQRSVPFD